MVYDESETIDVDNALLNGGILVKVLALSVDPYLRRMMIGPGAENFIVSTRLVLGLPLLAWRVRLT